MSNYDANDVARICDARDVICGFCGKLDKCGSCPVPEVVDDALNEEGDKNE